MPFSFAAPMEPPRPPIQGAVLLPTAWQGAPPLPNGARVFEVKNWKRYPDTQRLRELRAFAEQYGHDPRVAEFVVNQVLIPAGVQQRDYPGEAAALLRWVQDHVYYVNEPGERIVSPWLTVQWGFGDCDCIAVLIGAMAHSIRLPWRFVLAGRDRQGRPVSWPEPLGGSRRRPPRGWRFFHIFTALGWPKFQPTTWMAAEGTVKGAPLGYDPARNGPLRDGAGPSAMHGAATFYGADEAVDAEGNVLFTLVKKLSWEDIITDAVKSVISTLLAAMVLAWATRAASGRLGRTSGRLVQKNPRSRGRRRA